VSCVRLAPRTFFIFIFYAYLRLCLGFLRLRQHILGLGGYLFFVSSFFVDFYILLVDGFVCPSPNSSPGSAHTFFCYVV
jgi:hypothetical protein